MRIFETSQQGKAEPERQSCTRPLQARVKEGAALGDILSNLRDGATQLHAAVVQREPESSFEEEQGEGEVLQGRFAAQRAEFDEAEDDDEPVQGKAALQRLEDEEEEPVQARQASIGGGRVEWSAKGDSTAVSGNGLPAQLRAGAEALSGLSLADVSVRYNSPEPAKIQAHAYTRGAEIHVAPGQERHLPHEAWHAVQQKQGRVQATRQLAATGAQAGGGVSINDNAALEKEADVMGARAVSAAADATHTQLHRVGRAAPVAAAVQMVRKRVKGGGSVIVKNDIFFDKNNGRYYNDMEETGPDKVTATVKENEKYDTSKTRSENTILLKEAVVEDGPVETIFLKPPIEDAGGGKSKGTKVSVGSEMTNPPPAIRLYAEGNMDHAAALAESMTGKDEFEKFLKLGTGELPFTPEEAPLIKATEYAPLGELTGEYYEDHRKRYKEDASGTMIENESGLWLYADAGGWVWKHGYSYWSGSRKAKVYVPGCWVWSAQGGFVKDNNWRWKRVGNNFQSDLRGRWVWGKGRYAEWGRPDTQGQRGMISPGGKYLDVLANKEGKYSNLEASFGGGTGDMTKAASDNKFRRLYDVIQSTFFWNPDVNSGKNAEALTAFMKNKGVKVKPGGILRVVGINSKPRSSGWETLNNRYLAAAQKAVEESKSLDLYDTVKLDALAQSKTYSSTLEDAGLNHDEQFKHLRTANSDVVESSTTYGDYIITAKRKPPPEETS